NPKIQTRLSRAMRHPALSGLIVQTFPSVSMLRSLLAEIDGGSSVVAPAVGASAHTQSAAIARLIDIGR
ncbi:hypothetical protein VDQ48_14395, partial [Xanthomonas campestris pv. campestris]|nr:hypothetical protein [Xanthomonas campestris pv. campestris]